MSLFWVRVNGRHIDKYYKDDKWFVEGRKGSSYEIEFNNNSSQRKKIVVSVDGLNVVSGDNDWEQGYVVEPHQRLVIPGWRKDAGNVAKFIFSSLKGSYNQHNDVGNKLNIGVIGCRVFDEVVEQKHPYHYHYHYNNPYYISPYYIPYYISPYYIPYYTYPTYVVPWNDGVGIGSSIGGGYTTLTGGGSYNNLSDSAVNLNTFNSAGPASVACEVKSDPFIGTMQCSYTCDNHSGPIGANLNQNSIQPTPQNAVGTGWGENKQFQTHDVNYQFSKNYSEDWSEEVLIYIKDNLINQNPRLFLEYLVLLRNSS